MLKWIESTGKSEEAAIEKSSAVSRSSFSSVNTSFSTGATEE